MTRLCCVCKKRYPKGDPKQLFRFPIKNASRLKLWEDAIRKHDITKIFTKSSSICSDHFSESDYVLRPGAVYKRLRPNAVPSIFPSFPAQHNSRIVRSSGDQLNLEENEEETIPKIKLEINDEEIIPEIKLEINDEEIIPAIKLEINDEEIIPAIKLEINDEEIISDIKLEINDEEIISDIKLEITEEKLISDIKLEVTEEEIIPKIKLEINQEEVIPKFKSVATQTDTVNSEATLDYFTKKINTLKQLVWEKNVIIENLKEEVRQQIKRKKC